MRFATLVVLAVVASTTPSLAAPAPYTYVPLEQQFGRPTEYPSSPHRANPKRDITTTALVQNGTLPANVGSDIIKLINDIVPEVEQLLGHAVNGTVAHSNATPKRNTVPDIVQAIEAALEGLTLTRKRDVTAESPNYLETAIPIEGIADASHGVEPIIQSNGATPLFHDRRTGSTAPKVSGAPPKASSAEVSGLTTWLKNLGNVASIGSGGAAIVGAIGASGASNSTKREFVPTSDEIDLARILDGSTPHFHERRTGGAAQKVSSAPPKISSEPPKVSSTGGSSLTTWLQNLGNVASAGAGGAAVVGAISGSGAGNSTKREFVPASNEIDLAGILDGSTPHFHDRRTGAIAPKVSIPKVSTEVSGFESILGKVAGVASVGGTAATVLPAVLGSSNSTKRDLDLDTFGLIPSADEKRSISSSVLQEIISILGGAIGGSGSTFSIKRSASDNDILGLADITPEQLQHIVAQMNSRGVDLD